MGRVTLSALTLAVSLLAATAQAASADPTDPSTVACAATTNMTSGSLQHLVLVRRFAELSGVLGAPSCVTGPLGCGGSAATCTFALAERASALVGRAAVVVVLEAKVGNVWSPVVGPDFHRVVGASCSNGKQTSINTSSCRTATRFVHNRYSSRFTYRLRCQWQWLSPSELVIEPALTCNGRAA